MTTSSTPLTTRRETFADGLTIRFDERQNDGRPMLILHGGGGSRTVAGLAAGLSRAHVVVPTHPGFEGEPRPEWFNTIDDLAFAYLDLLERLNLHNVLVIGSSVGGWIASAMALHDTSRLVSGLLLLDAGGIQVEGYPVVDVSTLSRDELFALSFHDPTPFTSGAGAPPTPEEIEGRKADARALATYDQGLGSSDPKLKRRLKRVNIPVIVAWGASDGVMKPEYGRAYAQAFPNARFELIPEAGHLPQIEQPDRVLTLVRQLLTLSVKDVERRSV